MVTPLLRRAPPTILARYMLLQLAGPFSFGLALFSGVLLLDKLFDVVDLLVNKGVSLTLSAKIFALFLPTTVSLSIPMALLLAFLLAFGRLSEDNEMTALRASGLSFRQILWSPLACAAGLCLLLLPFNGLWAPRSMAAFRALYNEIANQDPLVKIEPGQFTYMRDIRIFPRKVDRAHNLLQDVMIYQRRPDFSQRIYARTGAARSDARLFSLNLQDGQIERFTPGQPRDVMHIRFKNYTLLVPFVESSDERKISLRERTTPELLRLARQKDRDGLPAGDVRAEVHMRVAVAFAPLALSLLGMSLGMTLERGGRGVGFGAAVGVLFAYYLLLILGFNLAERRVLPPFIALWLANGTALVVGADLYRRRVLR